MFCCRGFAAQAAGIRINVSDQLTNKPIAHARVSVNNTAITAVTANDGFCYLEALPRGNITIVVSAKNYHQKAIPMIMGDIDTTLRVNLEPLKVNLQEVTVAAQPTPRSDHQARISEREAVPLVDIASGDMIVHTGSISAGDVVQQLQGLSVTHTNTGNSDKAIIRGMEAKYSYTLINGFKIPSPDDKSRYISLDIFPAGLLQNVQVYKTLTADMEGDAIGGAVNLVLRQPEDAPLLQVDLSTGYGSRYFDNKYRSFNSAVVQNQSPYERFGPGYYARGDDFSKDNLVFHNNQPAPDINFNVLAGHSWLSNRLGLMTALNYKNIRSGSTGFFIPLNVQPNLNNVPAFSDFYLQTYNNKKTAVSNYEQLWFRPDDSNSFRLSYLYLDQKDAETRSLVDTSLVLGRSQAGTGRIYISDRSRVHEQQINNVNLQGSHRLGQFSADWAGVYSQANGRYPDWSQLTANTGRLIMPDGTIQQSPVLLAPLNRIWLSNKERDLDAYLDLHYKPRFFNNALTLSAGGVLRDKKRDNFYNSYTFVPLVNEPFAGIKNAVWSNDNGPQNPLGNANNQNTYTATEHISAFYIMANWQRGRSELTGGLRREQTRQNFVSALDASQSFGKTVNISYKDLLPNLHWRYTLNNNAQLKASYFKGISRPALYDITFETIAFEDYNVAGNPFLKRTQADNFDLSYNWYKNRNMHIKTALFYKHMVDAYERTLINGNDVLYPIPQNGLSYTPALTLTEQLKNTGTATNYGAEFSYSYTWPGVVLSGSYTYTSSSLTRMKKLLTREDPAQPSSNQVTITRMETGPLQGQSKHLAYLNLLCPQLPGNWLVNATAIYTGRRIDLVSPWYGLDYWQRANLTLNLSVEKKLSRHLKLSLNAANLFNNGFADDILTPNPSAGNNLLPAQNRQGRIAILKKQFSAYYRMGLTYTR